MAKAIMIQGTASNVGKTILTLALCRIFKEDGHKVAPFKAQNITANTVRTGSGEEIAVSQWLQAMAAGLAPDASMNPVLLKPGLDHLETQVIVKGKPLDEVNLYDFKGLKERLIPAIMDAYSDLSAKHDIIVIEGAGSPVELNLNQDDIVNMGMAKRAKSPVLLAADIDRGGIFASLYGTVNLLDETERGYVKGLLVNRFRGEARLFEDGKAILEQITGLPVAGVIPYIDVGLPEEDSLCDQAESSLREADFESRICSVAATVREALDMRLIYQILHEGV